MNRKAIIGMLIGWAAVILLVVPLDPPHSHAQSQSGQVVSSGQAESRQFTVQAQGPFRSSVRKTPPDQPPPRKPPIDPIQHPRMDPPVDPSVRPEDIRPTSPETVVKVVPKALSGTPRNPDAPGTFTFYRNTALANAPVVGGATLTSSTTNEPSLGSNGRLVFWTQNWYTAVSADRGQTFTYINPYDNFPADGVNDPVNNGFCCDQIAYYERTRGLTLWLLQYSADNNTNTQRLAVARSQADVLNNTWIVYDFTPATFGYTTPPAGASGFWLDYPDMAVSDNFLYLTTNVFPRVLPNPTNPCAGTCPTQPCPGPPTCTGGCTNPCTAAIGSVIARIPLNDLAAGQNLGGNVYTDANSGYRATHGARGTMYWGTHILTTQIRIYRWAENSGQVAWDDVNHAAFNTGAMTAISPDGNDFAASADTRIQGAWVANGVIGFMWNAAQSTPPATAFPFPHVQVLRFNENNRTLIGQGQIWNNVEAFLYPSVAVNDRGHLGGTMAAGGGATFYPRALSWIADDFNGGTIAPLESLAFAGGNAGPLSNRWGDYLSARINVPFGNTWVGSGYALTGGTGNAAVVPRFIWFGRERDTPPAANTIYVDRANTSRYQDGSSAHPYRTVTDGHFAAMAGDTLIIRAGNYNETVRFNTAVTVRNEGGIVRIGAP